MLARALLVLPLLIFPLSARAVDVDLSLYTSGEHDSNVERQDEDGDGDISFEFGSRIVVHDRMQRVVYRLQYSPFYEVFVDRTDFNQFHHIANGEVEWQVGDKTTVVAREQFSLTESVNEGRLAPEESVTGEPIEELPDTELQRSNILRNSAMFQLRHTFSPRIVGTLSVNHEFFDADDKNVSSDSSLSSIASLDYALNAKHRVGFGGGANWQQFEGVRGQPGSDTFTYRIFGSWSYEFGANTTFSIQAGPALIVTKQDAPDPEKTVDIFPHELVVQSGTIGQVYDRLGLDAPNMAKALNGADLPSNTIIPVGSILIPVVDDCTRGTIDDGTVVFTEANCAPNRIALAGTDDVFIANVLGVGMAKLTFLPGADPGKTDGSTVTYFGNVSLNHSWRPNLFSKISYNRSDSSASSLGSATIIDQVTFLTRWEPSGKFDLNFQATWLQRNSANELSSAFRSITVSPVADGTPICGLIPSLCPQAIQYTGFLVSQKTDRSVDTSYWSVAASVGYQLSRRMSVSGRLAYQNQNTKQASATAVSTFQNVTAFVGLRYDFEPFHF